MDKVCCQWKVSIRRACRVLLVDTSTYHYKPRRRGQADIEKRIKEICETRIRYGYRRVHVLLRREGWMINMKRTRRIYAELGLQLRNKTPKRRGKAKLREDRSPAAMPNETWAMDFVHDKLATGKKLRVLTVVDIFSKFSPVIDPRFSYRAEDVVLTLEWSVVLSAIPRQSVSTKVRSSSRAISTCGLTRTTSSSTSAGQGSQRTMRLSKPSTASSGPSV